MLLPPPATAAAVVVVGCWTGVVAGGAAAVVMGFAGGLTDDCWAGDDVAGAEVTGATLLAESAEELTAALVAVRDGDAAPVLVGMATDPVPAPDAVPSEGVAWHVADKPDAKAFRPSDCKGSDGPAGRVPT